MSRYDYCRILVTEIAIADTQSLLGRLFEGTFQQRTLTVGDIEVEVRRNPDGRDDGVPCNDFVRWPVQIEIEPNTPHGEAAMVETVSRALEALWNAKAQAVAACDFEDELPWNGGIQRLRPSETE
ncbi:hypothetical protein ACFWGI_20675 [Streptomyces niveus]|uniref:hypothetical protein n=1 Tax=Streptomyces niveus TaxID=193462 RepID=UPI00365BE031